MKRWCWMTHCLEDDLADMEREIRNARELVRAGVRRCRLASHKRADATTRRSQKQMM